MQNKKAKQKAEKAVTSILEHIGEDITREGLVGTPERVVRMWEEMFRGYKKEASPKVTIFKNGDDGISYDQLITDTGVFHSTCEHHMLPFFGRYVFGYIPSGDGNIIGLSKVARVVDYHAAKLQIQERLCLDIATHLWNALCTEGSAPPLALGVFLEAEHLCKTMRGAKKQGTMTAMQLMGGFQSDNASKSEFLVITKK